jgi:hypothetical protein
VVAGAAEAQLPRHPGNELLSIRQQQRQPNHCHAPVQDAMQFANLSRSKAPRTTTNSHDSPTLHNIKRYVRRNRLKCQQVHHMGSLLQLQRQMPNVPPNRFQRVQTGTSVGNNAQSIKSVRFNSPASSRDIPILLNTSINHY